MVKKPQLGFTFIEMMIVVAIIAILVAIAYPSYQQYVLKAKRSEARAELLQISAKLQRYKIANFTFLKNGTTAITLADINQPAVLPQQGPKLYNLELTGVTAGTWVLTATPKNDALMKGNGVITLNSQGQKCWIKGQTTCTLSETSSWEEK